jgi:NDP-sugar pyrophosphorylase family protein
VVAFRQKAQVEGDVNGGLFVFERGVFDYLRGPDDLELEEQPLESLARDGHAERRRSAQRNVEERPRAVEDLVSEEG